MKPKRKTTLKKKVRKKSNEYNELKVLRDIEKKLQKKTPLTNVELEIASSPCYAEGFGKYFK